MKYWNLQVLNSPPPDIARGMPYLQNYSHFIILIGKIVHNYRFGVSSACACDGRTNMHCFANFKNLESNLHIFIEFFINMVNRCLTTEEGHFNFCTNFTNFGNFMCVFKGVCKPSCCFAAE